MTSPREHIVVYGASGYTGRRVARELVRRGQRVVLSGRSRDALLRVAQDLDAVTVMPAALDDESALSALLEQAAVVINCAGPFATTAVPLVRAAIATKTHYLDVSGEQGSVRFAFEQADAAARAAGVALAPGFAFFSAIADALTAILSERSMRAGDVTVAYAIDNWRPSDATLRARMQGVANEWYEYANGIRAVRSWPATQWFEFPAPIGRRRVTPQPMPEVFTIPRHVTTNRVRSLLTTSTLIPDPFGALLPVVSNALSRAVRSGFGAALTPVLARAWRANPAGEMLSDPTRFTVVVQLDGASGRRTAVARGRGIYDVTVPMVVSAAERVLRADFEGVGALAPSQAVEPVALLDALRAHGLEYELDPRSERSVEFAAHPAQA